MRLSVWGSPHAASEHGTSMLAWHAGTTSTGHGVQRPQEASHVPGPRKLLTSGAEQSGWKATCQHRYTVSS